MIDSRKIDLMIAGAQRSGTTSLLNYLGQHPDICRSHTESEIAYFIDDTAYNMGYERVFSQHFDLNDTCKPVVLAKSIGIMYQPVAMERLLLHNPDVQIIIVLRNPVDRAYSGYWYARRQGLEDENTFEKALDAHPDRFGSDELRNLECAYLDRGLYAKHLEQLFSYFKKEQVHVFLFEDMVADSIAVCRKIFGLFDKLDMSFRPDVTYSYNEAALPRLKNLALLTSSRQSFPVLKKMARLLINDKLAAKIINMIRMMNVKKINTPPMNDTTRKELLNFFEPYNDKLSHLIRRDVSHWNR